MTLTWFKVNSCFKLVEKLVANLPRCNKMKYKDVGKSKNKYWLIFCENWAPIILSMRFIQRSEYMPDVI